MKNTSPSENSYFSFRPVIAALVGCALLLPLSAGAAWKSHRPKQPAVEPGTPTRVFPRVTLGEGQQLEYVGTFACDGKYKALSKMELFVDSMKNASAAGQPAPQEKPEDQLKKFDELRSQVPPAVELPRNERQVEDFQPPERAVKVAKSHSVLANLRDSIVSLPYGAEQVLNSPEYVTTDSRNRVIVSDTTGVHVLAFNSKDSYQIVGGPGRRLQSPAGVAVDSDDNVYVADYERGIVLVYDADGKYLRTLGDIADEGTFESPTGLAIDQVAKRLYVADEARHAVFILDLNGKLLGRVGTPGIDNNGFNIRSGNPNPDGFEEPESLLIHNNEILVVDGKRIHVLTLGGQQVREFAIEIDPKANKGRAPGLFMDASNHLFVSDPAGHIVREYDHEGKPLGAFGQPGLRSGEFIAPAGMWADRSGRVFIVDARRVQVFKLSHEK